MAVQAAFGVIPPYASYSIASETIVPGDGWQFVYASLQAYKAHVQEYPGCQRLDVYVSQIDGGDMRLHSYSTGTRPSNWRHSSSVATRRAPAGGLGERAAGADLGHGEGVLMAGRSRRPAQAAVRLSGHRRGRPPGAAYGHPGLDHSGDHRAWSTSPGRWSSTSSSPACARAARRMWLQHVSSLAVPDLRAFFAVGPWGRFMLVPGRTPPIRTSHTRRRSSAGTTEAREVLRRRRRLPRAREPAHGRQEPAVAGRVAGARRLRGPSRPRPLEHACDDRRRRNADRHRALLVRPAADRRAAARERGARAGRRSGSPRAGSPVFYVAFVANGIAIGLRVETAGSTRPRRRTWASCTGARSAWVQG